MGLLDLIAANTGGSPWNALYPDSPVLQPDPQQVAAQQAAALGALGIDPASLPQRSPFDVPNSPLPASSMPQPAPSPAMLSTRV